MKLEVGMYVRTNLGEIGKVTAVAEDDTGLNLGLFYNSEPYLKGREIKASHNIIDLIEIGDYVNGYKVTKINIKAPITNNKAIECGINSYGSSITYVYDNKDIKSIVTKEQFSQMEYKVGE